MTPSSAKPWRGSSWTVPLMLLSQPCLSCMVKETTVPRTRLSPPPVVSSKAYSPFQVPVMFIGPPLGREYSGKWRGGTGAGSGMIHARRDENCKPDQRNEQGEDSH